MSARYNASKSLRQCGGSTSPSPANARPARAAQRSSGRSLFACGAPMATLAMPPRTAYPRSIAIGRISIIPLKRGQLVARLAKSLQEVQRTALGLILAVQREPFRVQIAPPARTICAIVNVITRRNGKSLSRDPYCKPVGATLRGPVEPATGRKEKPAVSARDTAETDIRTLYECQW